MTKKNLRTHLKAELAALSPQQITDRSTTACLLLTEQPEYDRAEQIMVFLPSPNEINTTQLVLNAWRDHKRVIAPRVSWEQRRMVPIEIRSLTEHMADTPWGFRQPLQGDPVPISMIDLVIVPGLGFDPAGNRLGRGRGFYDRFLAGPDFRGLTCGLSFEEQFVGLIPSEPHDRSVDLLVTDQTVRRFH